MVPVSIRTKDERHQLGNRVAAMLGPLPVYVEDPVQRLAVVQEAMRGLKESKQALGAEVLAGVQEFAPPTILAQAARINFHPRLFNTIVTNVPGPQVPLYLLGRRLTEIVPVGFLPDRHAVFFAVMSYDGKLDFGLLGDRDAMRDLDELATGIVASLNELRRAAGLDRGQDGRSATAGPTRRRAPAAR